MPMRQPWRDMDMHSVDVPSKMRLTVHMISKCNPHFRLVHRIKSFLCSMQHALRTMHESATEEALNFYNSEAVGTGVARKKYEKLLIAAIKRSFEVPLNVSCSNTHMLQKSSLFSIIITAIYAQEKLRKVTIEAELKCVKMVEKMDEEIWTICQSSETTLGHALEVSD
jgi:hypothetical protein